MKYQFLVLVNIILRTQSLRSAISNLFIIKINLRPTIEFSPKTVKMQILFASKKINQKQSLKKKKKSFLIL